MLRLTFISLAILSFIFSAITACTDDNAEDLQPLPDNNSHGCDTATVTFSKTVVPILAANCYACHASNIAEGDVVLDGYAGVKEQAGHGHLIGVITHAPGFPPMPEGGPKLSDCDIAKIRRWVDSGAPNN